MYPNNIAVSDGANSSRSPKILTGNTFGLAIGETPVNGPLLVPVLRRKCGEALTLNVTNIFCYQAQLL